MAFNEPTIVRLDHTKALKREVQQAVAMLKHIGQNAAAIVKPAEYIGQWSGIVSRTNEHNTRKAMCDVYLCCVSVVVRYKTKLHQVASTTDG